MLNTSSTGTAVAFTGAIIIVTSLLILRPEYPLKSKQVTQKPAVEKSSIAKMNQQKPVKVASNPIIYVPRKSLAAPSKRMKAPAKKLVRVPKKNRSIASVQKLTPKLARKLPPKKLQSQKRKLRQQRPALIKTRAETRA